MGWLRYKVWGFPSQQNMGSAPTTTNMDGQELHCKAAFRLPCGIAVSTECWNVTGQALRSLTLGLQGRDVSHFSKLTHATPNS